MQIRAPLSLLAIASLAACASMSAPQMAPFSQMSLPDAVKVPAGHAVARRLVTEPGRLGARTAATAARHRRHLGRLDGGRG